MEKNKRFSDAALIKRGQGLTYKGVVTAISGTTEVTVASLKGYGNDFFCSASYADWEMFHMWDAGGAGAAPQGLITRVTDYVSSTGAFTITAFASGTTAVGDIVMLLHPILAWFGTKVDDAASGAVTTTDFLSAYIKQILNELLGTDGGWTAMTNTATASLDVALQKLAAILNIDGSNLFSVAVDGQTASTDLDSIFTNLAAQLGTRAQAAAAGAVTTTDTIMGYLKQLINIYQLADADLDPSVLDDSPFAHILAKDGDVSAFDDNLHSLEALYDKMVAVQGGSETLESIDDELDAMIDMAKTPDTRTLATLNTEETISAFTTTNTNPMYISGIWLGMENMVAGDVIRWRVFPDWDNSSIADQITDDEIWTFSGVDGGSPTGWMYMPLGFWVTYEIQVKVTQIDGTLKTVYSVLDIGQRGS